MSEMHKTLWAIDTHQRFQLSFSSHFSSQPLSATQSGSRPTEQSGSFPKTAPYAFLQPSNVAYG